MSTSKKVQKSVKKEKVTAKSKQKISLSKFSLKNLWIFGILIVALFVAVGATQQQQITVQEAQTVPSPTMSVSNVTPTYGCLGTSCVGTIVPTGVTAPPVSPSAIPTIALPTNPNGKTPPGLIVSAFHRLLNWFSKIVRFGGNPPGNPNIPGTNINPMGSGSGNLNNGNGKQNGHGNPGNVLLTGIPNQNSSGGGTVNPLVQPTPSLMTSILNFFQQLFGQTPK